MSGVGRLRRFGTEANARLTSSTALVLLVLLAIEGVTVLQRRVTADPARLRRHAARAPNTRQTRQHLLAIRQVLHRIAPVSREGTAAYGAATSHPAFLTIVLFGSGILLLIGPFAWRANLLTLHQASFVLWFACMTVHVLGHIQETAQLATKDWVVRTRVRVAGSRWRRLAITTSLVVGVVLGFLTIHSVGPWLSAR